MHCILLACRHPPRRSRWLLDTTCTGTRYSVSSGCSIFLRDTQRKLFDLDWCAFQRGSRCSLLPALDFVGRWRMRSTILLQALRQSRYLLRTCRTSSCFSPSGTDPVHILSMSSMLPLRCGGRARTLRSRQHHRFPFHLNVCPVDMRCILLACRHPLRRSRWRWGKTCTPWSLMTVQSYCPHAFLSHRPDTRCC